MRSWLLGIGVLGVAANLGATSEEAPAQSALRFEIRLADGLVKQSTDGRVIVVFGRAADPEPRLAIGRTERSAPVILGADAQNFQAEKSIVLDENSAIFPLAQLSRLPAGAYHVQAVLARNRDLNMPDAPGNLYSAVQAVTLDPAKGGVVKLTLTKAIPDETLPKDTEHVKYLKLRSGRLSKFHGRPMYLRAAVILPRDFAKQPERRYPLRVRIGGYGTRFSDANSLMEENSGFRKLWLADDMPRMLLLQLDGAGPLGDPYQVNSANNGPYGDAVTQELIPHVEKLFRGIGTGKARVLDGHSTGGWVSLALQVFYPDFFNGCWSSAPDPVDFRAFELIDIYADDNAFVNSHGFERPSSRTPSGDVLTTMRHETNMERVLGRGNRWELSGKDWCAWNAVFGPRGADGLPRPLWDGVTGKLDRSVVEHWKKYDLRLVLEANWKTLGPKLRGKLHIAVGDADDYFLNNAVYLLDRFLSKAQPPYEGSITYGPREGHGFTAWTDKQMIDAMGKATGARP